VRRSRALSGVEFVVSDDHAGLKRAISEQLTEAAWQRCYVHFLRNALDHLPRKADDDCMRELRWLYDRRDVKEAQSDLSAWLKRWEARYPKLTDWVEENIGETLSFYRLPLRYHKHLKSTNLLERLNEQIKRRTRVVLGFPSEASCLRLIRALCCETHKTWTAGSVCARAIQIALQYFKYRVVPGFPFRPQRWVGASLPKDAEASGQLPLGGDCDPQDTDA
jgi:transposase-like protein